MKRPSTLPCAYECKEYNVLVTLLWKAEQMLWAFIKYKLMIEPHDLNIRHKHDSLIFVVYLYWDSSVRSRRRWFVSPWESLSAPRPRIRVTMEASKKVTNQPTNPQQQQQQQQSCQTIQMFFWPEYVYEFDLSLWPAAVPRLPFGLCGLWLGAWERKRFVKGWYLVHLGDWTSSIITITVSIPYIITIMITIIVAIAITVPLTLIITSILTVYAGISWNWQDSYWIVFG